MPNLNGTGPKGEGKMTGRGEGDCDDSVVEEKKEVEEVTKDKK